MRRRDSIQLFSTSSIDLLACGLGAVLVLWLLVFGNQGGSVEGQKYLGSGEIRIRQYGISHLIGFQIDGYSREDYVRKEIGEADSIDASSFNASVSFRDNSQCTNVGRKPQFTAVYTKPNSESRIEISCKASNAFAKEITIRFTDMTSAQAVKLTIQTCAADEVHYLEMQTIDRRGVNEARYVFHCKDNADKALKFGRKPNEIWEKHFQQQIKKEIEKMCPTGGWETPLRYWLFDCSGNEDLASEVRFSGDGAINFVRPSLNPIVPRIETINGDSAQSRVQTWSGGIYGARRIPEGLPACLEP